VPSQWCCHVWKRAASVSTWTSWTGEASSQSNAEWRLVMNGLVTRMLCLSDLHPTLSEKQSIAGGEIYLSGLSGWTHTSPVFHYRHPFFIPVAPSHLEVKATGWVLTQANVLVNDVADGVRLILKSLAPGSVCGRGADRSYHYTDRLLRQPM